MKANDKALTKDLNELKKRSVERMTTLIDEEHGWLALSKEIAAHKAILGSMLGAAPTEDDNSDQKDEEELAKVMGNA